jgi:hypothetical protein
MWGLALRHAWGVKKDEREGFRWLRRAAGRAVEGLEVAYNAGPGGKPPRSELDGVKTELVLAIYEVGQCFFHGWGVAADRKMAVSYYQVAARLGDVDAQQALAFCYANGRGTKKDLKEAAKWYRAAVSSTSVQTRLTALITRCCRLLRAQAPSDLRGFIRPSTAPRKTRTAVLRRGDIDTPSSSVPIRIYNY